MPLDIKSAWTIISPSAINFVLPSSTVDMPSEILIKVIYTQHFSIVTSFTLASIPVSQSSHITVWHSQSYCLTHIWYGSCFTFFPLAGYSLVEAARLLFMIGYHYRHLLAVQPRTNLAPRLRIAEPRLLFAFVRVHICCSDSLAEHIDICSDKCHKCSENVRWLTVISCTIISAVI